MHMAVAINRPVISLMGYTNPKRTGPYRRFHDLIVDAYGDPGEDSSDLDGHATGAHARSYHDPRCPDDRAALARALPRRCSPVDGQSAKVVADADCTQ